MLHKRNTLNPRHTLNLKGTLMAYLLANDGASEQQYLTLVKDIITHGDDRIDRTGVGTRALHGYTLRFDLSQGHWPLLTTKKIPWKSVANELFWFLSGDTHIRPLLEKKVSIWSDWPHSKYVKATGDAIDMKTFEKRILSDDEFSKTWGDLGPVYGKQWRRWKGPDGKEFDQIQDALDRLKNDPYSRRILFHGWNVAELSDMALPPCHLLYQFFVAKNKLSLTLYQRSCDVGLGLPFNIASAALLVRMVAQQVNLEPGELFWIGHDVHLYQNHLEPIQEQLKRQPKHFPIIQLTDPGSLFSYQAENIIFETPYEPDPSIKMDVAV